MHSKRRNYTDIIQIHAVFWHFDVEFYFLGEFVCLVLKTKLLDFNLVYFVSDLDINVLTYIPWI